MNRRSLCRWLALAVALALPASPPASAADDLGRFAGHWTRSEREADDAGRARAIESATAALPFWMRGLARSVMLSRMVPAERYTIRRTPDGFLISNGDEAPRPMLVDASRPVEGARLARRLPDGSLEQTWRHSESSDGTTFWSISESRELVVRVVVRDARLRANGMHDPVRYATRYSRIDAPATP